MTAQPEHPSFYVPSQDERTLACIAHLTVFVSSIGFLIAIGLWLYLQLKRNNPYAAFQAGQAVIFQFVVMILTFIVIGFIMIFIFGAIGIGMAASSTTSGEAAFGAALVIGIMIFVGVMILLTFGLYGYAIYAAVRSYQARPFRIPLVSSLAELVSPMPNVLSEDR